LADRAHRRACALTGPAPSMMAASPAAPWPCRAIRRSGAPRAFDLASPREYWHKETTAGPGGTRLPSPAPAGAVAAGIAAGQAAPRTRAEPCLPAPHPAAARQRVVTAATAPVTWRLISPPFPALAPPAST